MKKLSLILIGCFLTSVGVIVLKHSNIVTGGTAGLSLSASYLTNLPFSVVFFIINIPFYIFSFVRMGWKFTVSTIVSVSILSLFTIVDQWLPDFTIPMLLGAVLGGAICGIGLSILFMNGSSLGGSNILALFLQKRYNFNPGMTTFIFDFLVVLSGIFAVGIVKGLCSVLSIAITSKIISYYKNEIAAKSTASKKKGSHSINTTNIPLATR